MRKALVVAGSVLAMVAFPQVAHAEKYLTKQQAESNARDAVATHYEDTKYSDVIADCRPQGHARAQRGYVYNRWVCVHAIMGDEYEFCDDPDNEVFGGRVIITGRNGVGSYYYRVLNGLHCF